jgi:hypothetical protein
VIAKRKVQWPEIWNTNRRQNGKSPLDMSDPGESRVWRVELRAYKRHLKDIWRITTWADLDARLGDVFARMIEDIRYTAPTPDSNRARWPDAPIWKAARAELSENLFEMRCFVDPERVKKVVRADQREIMLALLKGNMITTAVIDDVDDIDLQDFVGQLAGEINHDFSEHPKRAEEKLAKARKRYVFL